MKLRNKKTGEIEEFEDITRVYKFIGNQNTYNSLAKLNAEWEDYEEPKGSWTIDPMNENYIYDGKYTTPDELERYGELGLKFDTKEEAEQAVEKLKAIQRLKSHYIKFKLDFVMNKIDFTYRIDGTLHSAVDEERIIFDDLALLFGGEE